MEKINFCKDWLFCKKDSKIQKSVTLPHDAMLGEERLADNPSGSGGAFFREMPTYMRKSLRRRSNGAVKRLFFSLKGFIRRLSFT